MRARRIDTEKLSRALSEGRVRVLRDFTGPTLELGPLQLYQSTFPERYVVWDSLRELWEIRQLNPVTGHDEQYELLFRWTAFDERGRELPTEVVDEMRAARGKYLVDRDIIAARAISEQLVMLYQPFDYAFVRRRIREWWDLRVKGARKLAEEIADHNRRVQRANTAHVSDAFSAFMVEDRRWLPVLARHHETQGTKQRAYEHERIPQLAVGIDLKEQQTRADHRA